MIYECAIIGGGPVGLNAVLILGRARKRLSSTTIDPEMPLHMRLTALLRETA
nr:hypothetical protein [Paenibacillus sp. B2(2019)]